jgi:hypothetical protein
MRRLRNVAIGAVCGAAIMLPLVNAGAASAKPSTSFTTLTLVNGWVNAPFSTSSAKVADIGGIVHFKGAISSGLSALAFTLPKAFRPATAVYVPVDLCNAANGRLIIRPSGVVSVQAEGSFSSAQCFTSLDGASFAKSPHSFTALKLKNGWINAPYSTSSARVADIAGIVHFKGAIALGHNHVVFTLPKAFRPATAVYVPVDLCNANKGRLVIQPSGVVSVQTETSFSEARCFTSLDGAWFAKSSRHFAALKLKNGWLNAPYSTSSAKVADIAGIVYFKGAINHGKSGFAFTLPKAFRPATAVYVPVDLCNANKGRLVIEPSGVVYVQQERTTFSDAHCFTSLDGASFRP